MTHKDKMDFSIIAVLCISLYYVFFNLIICWCLSRTRNHHRESSSDTFEGQEMIQMTNKSNYHQAFHDGPCTTIMNVGNDEV